MSAWPRITLFMVIDTGSSIMQTRSYLICSASWISHLNLRHLMSCWTVQSSGLVRHVFRLLRSAKEQGQPVPWVLLENVSHFHLASL